MDYNSKEFKKLQSKWYEKLKKTGFEDIESDPINDKYENLQRWSSHFSSTYCKANNRKDPTLFEAHQEYYTEAGRFLHDHQFDSQQQKLIWEFHSEGLSIVEIIKNLRKLRFKKYCYKDKVQSEINALKELMLRKYKHG